MQPKEELEVFYSHPDPWFFKTTPDDIKRKAYILHILEMLGPFNRVLDIGCGEAWITRDIHACERHGIELSDMAAERFPCNVGRVVEPDGVYDLVLATGVLYDHYDWPNMLKMIENSAEKYVLTCHIKEWELPAVKGIGHRILKMEFPYREHTQILRVFNVSASPHRA